MIDPSQVSVIVGVLVSLCISTLKMIPGFHATPKIVKLLTAVLTSILATLIQVNWVIDKNTIVKVLVNLVVAMGTYKIVTQPLKMAVRDALTEKK